MAGAVSSILASEGLTQSICAQDQCLESAQAGGWEAGRVMCPHPHLQAVWAVSQLARVVWSAAAEGPHHPLPLLPPDRSRQQVWARSLTGQRVYSVEAEEALHPHPSPDPLGQEEQAGLEAGASMAVHRLLLARAPDEGEERVAAAGARLPLLHPSHQGEADPKAG